MASLLLRLKALPIPTLAPDISSNLSFSQSETLSLPKPISPNSVSLSVASPTLPLIIHCGRGDRKTAKGKRFAHSFGNARPRGKKKGRGPPKPPMPPSEPKKDRFDND
ncbi:30S ribosomal protein S31, chloroplastic [Quercus lobata]|uniref:30S ribosomal protein S31, chloroplastic n=1 Tax=Quercus lobata TaxID=97700 RepID=A0A7N2MFK7_QUELO|nr:30S ribosomal protein S31, chloroplastic [Quercus lobata]